MPKLLLTQEEKRDRLRAQKAAHMMRARQNPDYLARHARYVMENKERIALTAKAWKSKNKDSVKRHKSNSRPASNARRRFRYSSDPAYRVELAARNRIRTAVAKRGTKKSRKTIELLGCTPEFFVSFIEAAFKPGMTWENYGAWEIDHVIPVSKFDIGDSSQQGIAFHYSNCQPLWKNTNRAKGAKLPGSHQPRLL